MTDDDKKRFLATWLEKYQAVNYEVERLRDLFKMDVESDLELSIWAMFDAYTKLLGDVAGDIWNSLDWFIYDNNAGQNGLEAGLNEEASRPIRTLDDLWWLIKVEG